MRVSSGECVLFEGHASAFQLIHVPSSSPLSVAISVAHQQIFRRAPPLLARRRMRPRCATTPRRNSSTESATARGNGSSTFGATVSCGAYYPELAASQHASSTFMIRVRKREWKRSRVRYGVSALTGAHRNCQCSIGQTQLRCRHVRSSDQ